MRGASLWQGYRRRKSFFPSSFQSSYTMSCPLFVGARDISRTSSNNRTASRVSCSCKVHLSLANSQASCSNPTGRASPCALARLSAARLSNAHRSRHPGSEIHDSPPQLATTGRNSTDPPPTRRFADRAARSPSARFARSCTFRMSSEIPPKRSVRRRIALSRISRHIFNLFFLNLFFLSLPLEIIKKEERLKLLKFVGNRIFSIHLISFFFSCSVVRRASFFHVEIKK